MLVLSRRVGQKIIISEDIVVSVVSVVGKTVRIGIEAPDHIKILRSEVSIADTLSPPTQPQLPEGTHG